MHAHMPPYTKPEAAYDSRRLYDETSAIAAAQDAKLDSISSVESKVRTAMQYLYHAQLLLKEAFPSRDRQHGIPAESADLAREVLTAEELKGFGIGDVEPRHVAETATTVATSRHPMAAEAIRDHDERLDGPEDRL